MSAPYQCPGCDLTGHDFSGQDLTGADLTGANLTGAVFDGCNLTGANLSGATLSGANFGGATLGGANLTGCDLTSASFDSPAQLTPATGQVTTLENATVPFSALGANWNGLDLTNAVIEDLPTNLTRLSAVSAVLVGLSFAGATLTNAHFMNAVLKGVDFSQAQLQFAVFTEADLEGAKFAGAQLDYAVFSKATLTAASFAGATMGSSDLTETELTGTMFDGTDLTTCSFTLPPDFSCDPTRLTSMQKATIDLQVLALDWSYLDLTGATIVGLDDQVDLTGLDAKYAVLKGMNLAGYTLANADLRYATLSNAHLARAKLRGAVMIYADCTGAVFSHADLSGADLSQAVLSSATITEALFFGANLSNAALDNVKGSGAQFGALSRSFNLPDDAESALDQGDPSSLAAAFAQNGIQLSSSLQLQMSGGLWTVDDPTNHRILSVVLSTPEDDSPSITVFAPTPFNLTAKTDLTALNTGDVSALGASFASNGVALSSSTTITLETGSWTLLDQGNRTSYVIRKDPSSGGQPVLGVFVQTTAANLTNAYMPNARLADSNLYAVNAPGMQMYGANATLANAILEEADLSGANLGSMNLKQAHLQGVVLDGAVLVNTHFNGANLTPAASGRAASFSSANMAGADFTDALMYNANLAGAAVGVQVGQSTGVYLFSVGDEWSTVLDQAASLFSLNPNGDSATFQTLRQALDQGQGGLATLQPLFQQEGDVTLSSNAQISTEHYQDGWQIVEDQAVTYSIWSAPDASGEEELYVKPSASGKPTFSLNPRGDAGRYQTYLKALQDQSIPRLKGVFQDNGYVLSAGAQIMSIQMGTVWRIVDTDAGYTVWSALDFNSNMQLYARITLENLAAAFIQAGAANSSATLRWQATVAVLAEGSSWAIDNDSLDPQNLDIGYMNFLVQSNGQLLDVYGSALHIARLGSVNRLEIDVEQLALTVLQASNLSPSSTCPNGQLLSTNQAAGVDWTQWMKTSLPPEPPTCVPNADFYCNPPTTGGSSDQASGGERSKVTSKSLR